MAAYDTRRPTRDVDLQGQRMSDDIDAMRQTICTVAAVPIDDGLEFESAHATAERIREMDAYPGVRISLAAQLAGARLRFHVDVNVGDPVWPRPQVVRLPRLLDGDISIAGYPLVMVYAEKLVTALQRGTANTRWRDFADVYALAHRHDINGEELSTAIAKVAAFREVRLSPLADVLPGYADVAQRRWAAWCRKQRLDDRLPDRFSEILAFVMDFGDPAITGEASGYTWRHAVNRWQQDVR